MYVKIFRLQDCSNSSALAMELLQSDAKQAIWQAIYAVHYGGVDNAIMIISEK